ncbi:unnamed protein product [Caenorhabditis brenneri]
MEIEYLETFNQKYGKVVELDETEGLRNGRAIRKIMTDGWSAYNKMVEIDETEGIRDGGARRKKEEDFTKTFVRDVPC